VRELALASHQLRHETHGGRGNLLGLALDAAQQALCELFGGAAVHPEHPSEPLGFCERQYRFVSRHERLDDQPPRRLAEGDHVPDADGEGAGLADVAMREPLANHRLGRAQKHEPEAGAFGVGPVLELEPAGDREVGQEVPLVDRHRVVRTPLGDRADEVVAVAGQIEGQNDVAIRGADAVGSQPLAQVPDGLPQRVAGRRLVEVGPKQVGEVLPGRAPVGGAVEVQQQRGRLAGAEQRGRFVRGR
jgi:hypothetical protein